MDDFLLDAASYINGTNAYLPVAAWLRKPFEVTDFYVLPLKLCCQRESVENMEI